jgi:hypothetical protein
MVIYAQRTRMESLGGVSCAPSCVPATTLPMGTGMPMVAAAAWLVREHESALRQAPTAKPLSIVPNTIKRDAFAGISPGLPSTSPPV